jgi:energy-coupling factor transporter ATP-binding protein EcfA2
LKASMGQNVPVPLSSKAAQKQIERLPAEVLKGLRPTPASQILRVGRPLWESKGATRTVARSTPLVEWNNITYTYTPQRKERWFGNTSIAPLVEESALYDVSSMLWAGEIVALLGPNGAGKSTLLRTLNGLVRPQQGEVRVCGQSVRQRPVGELARVVGYAPQRPERLFFCSTVADELTAGPRALGIEAVTKAWQARLIEALDPGPLLGQPPYTLSIGQQRRVGLAAVLAAQPRVVALDEPTAALDASARATLAALLRELTATGAAIVIVTHDIDFAASIASRWLVLVAGRLVADDLPVRILANEPLLTEAALEPSAFHQLDFWLSQRLAGNYTPCKEETMEC